MNRNPSPDNITYLEENQIFVYGSNRAGIHGAGAALVARNKFGAQLGSTGMVGRSYGINTKGEKLEELPLVEINLYVALFLKYAQDHHQKEFLVTKIGCGLARHTVGDIAPMFALSSDNVRLPKEFMDYIQRTGEWAE